MFVLPLQEQVIFPFQKLGISLGRNIFEELCRHCEEFASNNIGLVCVKTGANKVQPGGGSASSSSSGKSGGGGVDTKSESAS